MAAAHAALHVGSVPAGGATRPQAAPPRRRRCRLNSSVVALAVIAGIVAAGSLAGFGAGAHRKMIWNNGPLPAGVLAWCWFGSSRPIRFHSATPR